MILSRVCANTIPVSVQYPQPSGPRCRRISAMTGPRFRSTGSGAASGRLKSAPARPHTIKPPVIYRGYLSSTEGAGRAAGRPNGQHRTRQALERCPLRHGSLHHVRPRALETGRVRNRQYSYGSLKNSRSTASNPHCSTFANSASRSGWLSRGSPKARQINDQLVECAGCAQHRILVFGAVGAGNVGGHEEFVLPGVSRSGVKISGNRPSSQRIRWPRNRG